MKKIFSVALSLILSVTCIFQSFAVSDDSVKTMNFGTFYGVTVNPTCENAEQNKSHKFVYSSSRTFSEDFVYCCRNFLNDDEKVIYDKIISSAFGTLVISFDCNISYENYTEMSFSDIAYAISYDHPEIFYYNGFTGSIIWEGDNDNVFEAGETITSMVINIVYGSEYDTDNISTYKSNIEDAIKPYLPTFDACATRVDLICAIHNFLKNYADFDSDYTASIKADGSNVIQTKHNIVGCLVDKKCVCQGYAETFKYLCNIYHIPCLTPVSENHMWNAVELDDGKWYVIDATWDDQLSTDAYFLKYPTAVCNGKTFETDHPLKSDDIITEMNLPYATEDYEETSVVNTRFSEMENVAEITAEKILIRSVSNIGDDIIFNKMYRRPDGNMGFMAPSGEENAMEQWRYVYLGDTNLDEEFTKDDYSVMINNALGAEPGSSLHFWANDVDMDGVIDVLDCVICEQALNSGRYIQVVQVS